MKRTLLLAAMAALSLLLVRSAEAADPLAATDAVTFDREAAAHLMRRAGFGAPPAELDRLVALGRDRAVRELLLAATADEPTADYPRGANLAPMPRDMMRKLDQDARQQVNQILRRNQNQQMTAVREWWLRRMALTDRPLVEKMALFWHGHFTSGYREVRQWQFLLDQNELFRTAGLGKFEPLLLAVSRDPAMLRYLDNARNNKRKPNENYARELMELFTMGEGNYTEDDVKAAARAFTGWGLNWQKGEYRFNKWAHDDGTKTFLGKTGKFDGEDVIKIILDQPATSRHMATRLWEFFAYPDPEPEIVEALAAILRASDFEFRRAVRAILRSDAFYSDRARGAMVKSPVELVVGSLRLLEVEPANPRMLYNATRQMGQEIFQPPNVKGWDGGRTWITTSTLFNRYNFAGWLLNGYGQKPRPGQKADKVDDAMDGEMMMNTPGGERMEKQIDKMFEPLGDQAGAMKVTLMQEVRPIPQYGSYQPPYDPAPVIKRYKLTTAERLVDHYIERLIQTDIDASRRAALVDALTDGGKRKFDPNNRLATLQVRGLIYLIMSMPEYQMN